MAFAGIGALSGAAFSRGITMNIGWRSHRLFNGALQPFPFVMVLGLGVAAIVIGVTAWRQRWRGTRRVLAIIAIAVAVGLQPLFVGHTVGPTVRPLPFALDILLGALVACFLAVLVGVGALRVKGLLLAISTMAFAIAAESYIFGRTIFTGSPGALTVNFPRGELAGVDLNHLNRNYYYFVLICLVVVLTVAGHLRRTGIGRAIIGVRENEPAAAALTVSPTRAKLMAFGLGGFISGLGGALLGGLVVTIGYTERFFTVADSLDLVAIRGDRRPREPGRCRDRRALGRRAARVLAQQRDGAVAHLEHRPSGRALVLPGRVHADRLLVARRAADLVGEAPAGARDEDARPRHRSRSHASRHPAP